MTQNQIAIIVMISIVAALAAFCFRLQVRASRRAGESRSWPAVSGTVESTQLLTIEGNTTPLIFYRYAVGGREYRANRLQFGSSSHFFLTDAYHQLRGLEAGDPVTVYYDPGEPSRAVLHRGQASNVAATAGWALAILMGLLMVVAFVMPPRP